MVTGKKNRLGTPPPIEDTLDALHRAEAEKLEQHNRSSAPPVIEQNEISQESQNPGVSADQAGQGALAGNASAKPESPRKKAKSDEKKIRYKQFNVSIPEDVFFAIKAYALEQRKSLQTVGIEILSDFVKKKLNKKKDVIE